MAQHSHVPKFGNWDSDNISYTSVFENVHKDKGIRPKNFNPNDPEHNPDAFVSGIFPLELEVDNSGIYGLVTQQSNKYGGKGYREAPRINKPHRGVNVELPARSISQSTGSSRFGSDKSSSSSSDNSNPHRSNRRLSRYSDDDSFRILPTPPQPSVRKPGRFPQRNVIYDVPSSVQNFGSWDEKDPISGNGFTEIFDKVKHEKQVTAFKLPKVPTNQNIHPSKQKNRAKSSRRSKIVCCVRPAIND